MYRSIVFCNVKTINFKLLKPTWLMHFSKLPNVPIWYSQNLKFNIFIDCIENVYVVNHYKT